MYAGPRLHKAAAGPGQDGVCPEYSSALGRAAGPCLFYTTEFKANVFASLQPGESELWTTIGPFANFTIEPCGGIPYAEVVHRNLSVVLATCSRTGDSTVQGWVPCSHVTTYVHYTRDKPVVLEWEEQMGAKCKERLLPAFQKAHAELGPP